MPEHARSGRGKDWDVELDPHGDGPVVPQSFGCLAHVSPPGQQVSSAAETQWLGNTLQYQDYREGLRP